MVNSTEIAGTKEDVKVLAPKKKVKISQLILGTKEEAHVVVITVVTTGEEIGNVKLTVTVPAKCTVSGITGLKTLASTKGVTTQEEIEVMTERGEEAAVEAVKDVESF
jgi:phosphoribosyl-dephospho-CoA transferase